MNIHTIYFDGASKGNPGESGAACIYTKNNKVLHEKHLYIKHATNNEAEYHAFILAIQLAIELKLEFVTFKGDSLLVVNQITNKWQVKSENLIKLSLKAKNLLKNLKNFKIQHVKRKLNRLADKGANDAIKNYKKLNQ